MPALKIIMTALGLFKALFQWWRERSIQDVAVAAERARLAEAERKAKDDAESVKRDSVANLIERMRNKGF